MPVAALAIAFGSVLAGAVSPAVAAGTYAVPAAIAADCSVAVDRALNAWLARVPDGAAVAFPAHRCYGVDGELRLTDRRGLTIDGRGSTFRALSLGDPRRVVWHLEGGSRLVLRNMTVRGFAPGAGVHGSYYIGGRSYEWQHAFAFSGVSGGLLDSVRAYGVYGDFVEAQADQRMGTPSRRITVRRSRFRGADRQAFGLTSVDGIVIQGNTVSEVAQAGVDLEPDLPTPLARNVEILGNRFHDVWLSIVSANGIAADNPDGVGNVTVAGNTMTPARAGLASCLAPVWVNAAAGAHSRHWTITDNTFYSIGPGISLTGVDGARIAGNRFEGTPGCRETAGVETHQSSGVDVGVNAFAGRPALVVKPG